MTVRDDLTLIFDTITVSSVIGYVMQWFTIPNLVAIFTLVWAVARAFESIFGKTPYEFFKRKSK